MKQLRARVREVLATSFVDNNENTKGTIRHLFWSSFPLDLTLAHRNPSYSRLDHNTRQIYGSFLACLWTRAV
jgi:hypothetical protein